MTGGRFHNAWAWPDERFDGLLAIANAINTAFDLVVSSAAGTARETELAPDEYPVWTPLRLADRMREAAGRIEELTAL